MQSRAGRRLCRVLTVGCHQCAESQGMQVENQQKGFVSRAMFTQSAGAAAGRALSSLPSTSWLTEREEGPIFGC